MVRVTLVGEGRTVLWALRRKRTQEAACDSSGIHVLIPIPSAVISRGLGENLVSDSQLASIVPLPRIKRQSRDLDYKCATDTDHAEMFESGSRPRQLGSPNK